MHFSPQAQKGAVVTVIVALGLALGAAAPASASGTVPTKAELADTRYCELTRIGDQFVRCDNLTGEGVLAPNWVPES